MEPVRARQITNKIAYIKRNIDFLKKSLVNIRELSAQIMLIDRLLYNMYREPSSFNDEKELRKIINFLEGLKKLIHGNAGLLKEYVAERFDSRQDDYEKNELRKGRSKNELVNERIDIIYEKINGTIEYFKAIQDIVLSFPEAKRDYPKVG